MTASRRVVRCVWETSGRHSFFASFRTMAAALDALKAALGRADGELRAFAFLEDRLAFVAEGPAEELESALGGARAEAGRVFRESDRKELWGEAAAEDVTGRSPEEAVRPLEDLLAAARLGSPEEYPWAGGDWLLSQT